MHESVHCFMMNRQADIKKTLTILASHMRERRRTLGLTQEKLAEVAELSTNYIARIELGLKIPSLSTTIRLAKALGMEVSDILADEDAKWIDEVQELAHTLRSLPDSEAEFFLRHFRTLMGHVKGLFKHRSNRARP